MIEVDLDYEQFRIFARELTRESAKATAHAINYAAKRVRTEGSKRIRAQVNLPAKYVNENLAVRRFATPDKPEAIISGRVRATRLARYNAKGLTAHAPYGRKGDALRGIPAGRKHAGVSVRVKKGAAKKMRKGILIPLQRGRRGAKENAWIDEGGDKLFGIFIRTGKGKKDLKHLYGPSVDQLWRRERAELIPMATRLTGREYVRLMRRVIARSGGR